MKIHEVQENLRNTIAGKEKYLAEWNNADLTETADRIHRTCTVGMLEHNIDELKLILADVDKAVEQYNELVWLVNPAQSEK